MADALDRVLNGMLEIVHRIDAPLIARAVMMMAQYAVHRRVAQQHVGGAHVDLGAQHAGAVRELAVLHALEQIEVLLDGTIAIGAVHAGRGERAAVYTHFLSRLIVHIGHAAADHVAGDFVQAGEEIGGIVEVGPVIAQPVDVVLDGQHELGVLLGRVGVVKAQVAQAAVFAGDAKVDAQRLGMADMQIAVRLGRETGVYLFRASAGQVGVDKLFDKIARFFLSVFHERSPLQMFILLPLIVS